MTRKFDVEVYLALGADLTADPTTWTWTTDITSYAMVRDGGVTIRRGRANWQTVVPPSSCNILLNNADGRFSRLNPTGPYYGSLTKNTPLRIRAREVGGSYSTRFVGYVSEWPSKWDPAEKHFWVPVQADGIMRRLGQGSAPIKSLSRSLVEYTADTFGTVTSYWPLEDGSGSTSAAAALPGGTPMFAYGTVDFAGATPPAGSLAAPDVSAGSLYGICTSTPATGAWFVAFYLNCTNNCKPVAWSTSGSMNWSIDVTTTTVTVTNSAGGSASFSAVYTDGNWHTISVTASEGSGSVGFTVFGDTGDSASSATSGTCGVVTSVTVNPAFDADVVSVGHVSAGNTSTSSITDTFMNGNPGNSAGSNFSAIGTYNDIFVVLSSAETENMGTYPLGSALEAFQECAAADAGQLIERANGRLALDTHQGRENLDVTLALDYDLGHIGTPFEPTDDDQLTRNDVTVSRLDGSSGRVIDQTGPLGVDTAGRYDETATLNLYTEDQAYHHAGWRVNLGTVNEYRYPVVNLRLHRSSDLIASWKNADVGSRVTIDNVPTTTIPPDLVDQIIEGYAERINGFEWDVALNLSPYKPYKVFEIADTVADSNEWLGRLAGDENAAIRTAITSSDTTITIDPNRYRWTTLLLKDTFTRSASSSWGTPDLGGAWALDVGTAADFSVNGSVGIQSHSSVGANHSQIISSGTPDHDAVIHFNLPAAPTGGGGQVIVVVRPRWTDANNHYEVRATVNTGGAITTELRKRVGGSPASLATGPNFTLSTSAWYAMRISCIGTTIRAKIWDTSGTEPDWQLAVTDTGLTTGNLISILSVTVSITNTLPYLVNFDNFAVSGAYGQPDDFNPLPVVRFGGETATVKGISTTAATYVAAGAASHADNSAVTPVIYAGSAANDGIFLVGRIRGIAGTLATPSGYTLLKKNGGLYLWMKVHSGSESSPSVTPSGGSSGDTVSAFTFGFRGTPCSLTDLTDAIVDSSSVSNASAANITYYGVYPWQQDGCLLLVVAGKSDDWTSAAISGWTEIAEPTTTTGSDQSLYAAYQIQTAPAVANEGTITVTGGASAVSEAMTFAIAAGYQTLTISARSTNGVTKAHSAGTKIEVDTYVLGL